MLGGSSAKMAVRRLGEVRAWFAAVAEMVDDAIIGSDLGETVIFWNPAAERLFGYSAEETVGQPITCIIPPERIKEEEEILKGAQKGERITRLETRWRRKDGTVIPVMLNVSPIQGDHDGIAAVCRVVHNLSDAAQTYEEFAPDRALLRSILATVPDALVVIHERGLICLFSPAAERLFGWSASEIMGQSVNLLMPSAYHEEHDSYLARYLATGKRHDIGISRVTAGQRRDGSVFPIELSIGEVVPPGARLFTGFIRDITERQERKQCLAELQSELVHISRLSELGQIVSALADEVNQPLTAISSYLGGAQRLFAAGNQAGGLTALGGIAKQSERARDIIQRLRDFVRKRETRRQVEILAKTIE